MTGKTAKKILAFLCIGGLLFAPIAEGATSSVSRNPRNVNGDLNVSGDIHLLDSKKIYLGTGNDSYLSYDGTNLLMYPEAVGSGYFGVVTAEIEAQSIIGSNAAGVQLSLDSTGTGGDEWTVTSAADSGAAGGGNLGIYNTDTSKFGLRLGSDGAMYSDETNLIFVPVGANIGTYITNASAGDTLVLGSGTYDLSAGGFTVSKALNIVGQGVGKTILSSTNASMTNITASNVRIANLSYTSTGNNLDGILFGSGNITGIVLEDLDITWSNANASNGVVQFTNVSGTVRNVTVNGTSSGSYVAPFGFVESSASTSAMTWNFYNVKAIASGAATAGYAYSLHTNGGATGMTINLYDCSGFATGASGNEIGLYVRRTTSGTITVNDYNGTYSGVTSDVKSDASTTFNAYGTTYVTETSAFSGTVTGNQPWASFTPTLTWAGDTPAGLSTVARYRIIDNVLFFSFETATADPNGAATGLEITMPVTAGNYITPVAGLEKVNATWTNPQAYVDTDDKIKFLNWSNTVDDQAFALYVSGSYEI